MSKITEKQIRERFKYLHDFPVSSDPDCTISVQKDVVDYVMRTLANRDKEIVAMIKSMSPKRFEPADSIWVGDENYLVGEHKLIPAKDPKDAMYCLNCERFLHEEGCNCGMVFVDDIITALTDSK